MGYEIVCNLPRLLYGADIRASRLIVRGGGTVPHAPFPSFPVKTLCPRPSFPLERENMTLGMGSRCNAPLGACSWAFFEKDDLG